MDHSVQQKMPELSLQNPPGSIDRSSFAVLVNRFHLSLWTGTAASWLHGTLVTTLHVPLLSSFQPPLLQEFSPARITYIRLRKEQGSLEGLNPFSCDSAATGLSKQCIVMQWIHAWQVDELVKRWYLCVESTWELSGYECNTEICNAFLPHDFIWQWEFQLCVVTSDNVIGR